jgi:hypothetical protein
LKVKEEWKGKWKKIEATDAWRVGLGAKLYKVEQRVGLHSLKTARLNGTFGAVAGYVEEKGRFRVLVDGEKESIAVKPVNFYLLLVKSLIPSNLFSRYV